MKMSTLISINVWSSIFLNRLNVYCCQYRLPDLNFSSSPKGINMSKPPYRPGPFMYVWKHFVESLKPKYMFPPKGELIGQDPFGNKYYEIPADPSRGKRLPKRWYLAIGTNKKEGFDSNQWTGFDSERPAEWEAWLRHRRQHPPTEEEVLASMALADMKKRNAAALEAKRIAELQAEGRYVGPPKPQDHEQHITPFPKYKEYELRPGEGEITDRWKDFKNPYAQEPPKDPKKLK